MARASVIEAQNHLQDAADRGHMSEEARKKYCGLAQAAVRDITALLEYLHSPAAARNAANVRAKRQDRRTQNSEPRTQNTNPEHEP